MKLRMDYQLSGLIVYMFRLAVFLFSCLQSAQRPDVLDAGVAARRYRTGTPSVRGNAERLLCSRA